MYLLPLGFYASSRHQQLLDVVSPVIFSLDVVIGIPNRRLNDLRKVPLRLILETVVRLPLSALRRLNLPLVDLVEVVGILRYLPRLLVNGLGVGAVHLLVEGDAGLV